jgi:DNA polymerase
LIDWFREKGVSLIIPKDDPNPGVEEKESLDKEHVAFLLSQGQEPDVQKVLELRQTLGGIAFKKLPVIQAWTREDRLRYAFLYHSAHTGRWASKGVQFHNLLKPTKRVGENYDAIVAAIMSGQAFPANIPIIEGVAGCLRASVHASEGSRLLVADYSSIENRVLAWMAQCPAMLAVFKGFDKNGKPLDPYKSFAALYYKIPYEDVTKEQRNFCKSPVLGCGYGMGWERLIVYAAAMGQTLSDDDAYNLVNGWREAYPEVCEYWDDLNRAVLQAFTNQCRYEFGVAKILLDGRDPKMFRIGLPSGRVLNYDSPQVGPGKFGHRELTHMTDDKTWHRIGAGGRSLTENIDQAISRDLLVNGMFNAIDAGFDVVLHVHDELVAEVPLTSPLTYSMFEECMTTSPKTWGQDIPLKVDGYEGLYYKKG